MKDFKKGGLVIHITNPLVRWYIFKIDKEFLHCRTVSLENGVHEAKFFPDEIHMIEKNKKIGITVGGKQK